MLNLAYYIDIFTPGIPGDISDIMINEITACSFTLKWSELSSNDLCDPDWYTVTISTGGMLIITDNTTWTNYTVTGLNDNTAYHVSVTANNNAGSSNVTSVMTRTNNIGKFNLHLYAQSCTCVHICFYVCVYVLCTYICMYIRI